RYGAVAQAKGRRDALDQAIVELAGEPPFCEVGGRLCCLRGVSTLSALALSVELGEWERFRAESLGPLLGLVPSEDPSGERRRRRRARACRPLLGAGDDEVAADSAARRGERTGDRREKRPASQL